MIFKSGGDDDDDDDNYKGLLVYVIQFLVPWTEMLRDSGVQLDLSYRAKKDKVAKDISFVQYNSSVCYFMDHIFGIIYKNFLPNLQP
jgi:hypothetical protein